MTSTVLVIYDGDCRFCRWGIGLVRRADLHRALRFCPYGNDESEQALAAIEPELRYTAMHALSDGRLYSGVDAAKLVLGRLPLGWVAVTLKMHAAYPFIARHRGVLGRFSPDRAAISMCRSRLVPG